MPENTTTVAETATPAAAEAKPSMRAADYLTAKSTETVVEPAKEAPPADPPKAEAKEVELDPETEKRLRKIANADKRVRAEKEEVERMKAELATKLEAANKWERLQETKSKGSKLAALKELYTEAEITDEVYWELNDLVLNGGAKDQKTADEKIAELVDAKVKEAEKAKTEAADKAQLERQAKIEQQYITGARAHIGKSPEKWPTTIAKIAAGEVGDRDIIDYVKTVYEKTGEAPSPEAALDAFERYFKKDSESAKVEEKAEEKSPPPAGVTGDMKANAPVTTTKPRSLKESLEEAKRLAGIIT